MGFELEIESSRRGLHGERYLAERVSALSARWAAADERLRVAQAAWRTLREQALPGDPRLIGAQLRLAQARHRRHELDEELGRLELELESPED